MCGGRGVAALLCLVLLTGCASTGDDPAATVAVESRDAAPAATPADPLERPLPTSTPVTTPAPSPTTTPDLPTPTASPEPTRAATPTPIATQTPEPEAQPAVPTPEPIPGLRNVVGQVRITCPEDTEYEGFEFLFEFRPDEVHPMEFQSAHDAATEIGTEKLCGPVVFETVDCGNGRQAKISLKSGMDRENLRRLSCARSASAVPGNEELDRILNSWPREHVFCHWVQRTGTFSATVWFLETLMALTNSSDEEFRQVDVEYQALKDGIVVTSSKFTDFFPPGPGKTKEYYSGDSFPVFSRRPSESVADIYRAEQDGTEIPDVWRLWGDDHERGTVVEEPDFNERWECEVEFSNLRKEWE